MVESHAYLWRIVCLELLAYGWTLGQIECENSGRTNGGWWGWGGGWGWGFWALFCCPFSAFFLFCVLFLFILFPFSLIFACSVLLIREASENKRLFPCFSLFDVRLMHSDSVEFIRYFLIMLSFGESCLLMWLVGREQSHWTSHRQNCQSQRLWTRANQTRMKETSHQMLELQYVEECSFWPLVLYWEHCTLVLKAK